MSNQKLPSGLTRLSFRLPIYIYRAGLGGIMPQRYLFLTHIGRISGEPRYAVVEVADYDAENDIYYIVSGYGEKANWYRNLIKRPQVDIQVGRRKMRVTAEPLSAQESGQKMVEYAENYPKTAKQLMRLIGHDVDGSPAAYRTIGEEQVRFLALHVDKELA